jgi:Sporulation and spore germination
MRRLVVMMALLAFAGCGTTTTSTSKGFQPIPSKEVDNAFKETPTTTTTVAPARPVATAPTTTVAPTTLPPTTTIPSEDVFLYFVTADGKFKEVQKRRPLPILPIEVVNELLKPPDATQKTYVKNGLVQEVRVGKITTVVLNPSYIAIDDVEKLQFIGQVTLTLTKLRSLSQVEYTVDGQVIEVPTPKGLLVDVGQIDYAEGVTK